MRNITRALPRYNPRHRQIISRLAHASNTPRNLGAVATSLRSLTNETLEPLYIRTANLATAQ
jgi:hypothetical protein